MNGPDNPGCKTCGKETAFKNYKNGYRPYCSNRCLTLCPERNQKISYTVKQKSPEMVKQLQASNLERYGVKNYYQTEDFKEKSKKIKLERYGNEYYSNPEKSIETCMRKYGVRSPMLLKEFQDKITKAKIDKYGHTGPFGFNVVSGAEIEVKTYLNDVLGFNFQKNKKLLGNRELDLYNEELKLAIEYCGHYWHCELHKPNNYHHDKYKRCLDKGVRLITIFEGEWITRQDQVKQFLAATLGKFETRIPARKCKVIEIPANREFFDRYHIQGAAVNNKFTYALIFEDEIVGAVSLGLHHRDSQKLVLNRLAFKAGIQVIGGASKLIKAAIRNLTSDVVLTTWSDNRWSTGEIYEKSGFKFDNFIAPDYQYYKNNTVKLISKQSQQKVKIGCPRDMTEHEYCNKVLKLYQIYDCGKKRWVYDKRRI